MKIALIKGAEGLRYVGGGVNYFIIRLFEQLKKEHTVKLIYGNRLLPRIFGWVPICSINGYDIIHAGTPEFAAFISSKAPILATFYDDGMCHPSIYLKFVKRSTDKLKLRINKEILKFLIEKGLKKCNKVVAISEEAKKGAIESFNVPEDKIVVIPPGIDTGVYKPLNIRKRDKSKLRLFFCGGISRRKGTENLLKALKLLKKKTAVELWLAGLTHPLFPLNQILKELNLTNEVKYFGFISNTELNQLYNEVDIFVMPSIFEGYGIPPLEALSCGTKVVCSKMPSIEPFREFITLTDTNPQSIADNILKAVDKKVNFKLVRKIIERDYSVKTTSEKYIKVYKELILNKTVS